MASSRSLKLGNTHTFKAAPEKLKGTRLVIGYDSL